MPAPGHGAVLATQETLDIMRLRYGENFAGRTQAVRYGETLTLDGVRVSFHPAGHVLGSAQIASNARASASSPPATTRTSPIRPARRSSWCPATSSSPRRRSAFRSSAIGDAERRDCEAAALGRALSRARASRRRLFARQGAARDRAAARGRLRQADLSAWRDGKDHALLPAAAASISASSSWCAAPKKAELAGAITICPPSRA